MKDIHIALDFDKTLAYHDTGWEYYRIGHPIEIMLSRLKEWIKLGYKVTIFTARVSNEHTAEQITETKLDITSWLKSLGLPEPPNNCRQVSYF